MRETCLTLEIMHHIESQICFDILADHRNVLKDTLLNLVWSMSLDGGIFGLTSYVTIHGCCDDLDSGFKQA